MLSANIICLVTDCISANWCNCCYRIFWKPD